MATSTEPIPAITEPQRLRGLGLFEDAAKKYSEQAEERPEDLSLHLEYAGLKLEQGLLGDCLDMLVMFESRIDRDMEQSSPRLVAWFKMFLSFCRAATEVKFETPMDQARQTFDAFIRDVAEEDYDHLLVNIASVYYRLLDLARWCGYETQNPMPSLSPEFQVSLAQHLLVTRDFEGALKIAKLGESAETAYETPHNMTVLQGIIRNNEASEVLRAFALRAYSDKILLLGQTEAWINSLKEAASAYDNAGHAFGSLQIEQELIQKQPSMPASDDTLQKLWHIADRLESLGNWLAVGECLQALAEISRKMSNSHAEGQALEIEKRVYDVSERCRNPLLWTKYNISRIQWSVLQGENTARNLELVEKVNNSIAKYDAPRLQTTVLMILSQSRMALGDPYTAAYHLPTLFTKATRRVRFLWGQDPFLNARLSYSSPPDGMSELQSLHKEMSEVRLMIETAQSFERSQEIQRLLHLAKGAYLHQIHVRGIHAVTQLVSCILSFAEEACASLEETHEKTTQGDIREIRSALLWSQAICSVNEREAEKFIALAPQLLHDASRLYHEAGQEIFVAKIEGQLSLTYERLWQLRGCQRDGSEFKLAVASIEKDEEIMKRIGSVRDLARVAQQAMSLYFGFLTKHAFSTNSPLATHRGVRTRDEEKAFRLTLHHASEADRLFNLIRRDRSSLQRQKAIEAKQELRKNPLVQSIFPVAIETNHHADRPLIQWHWIQKAKARSISDILALGINLPASLRNELNKNDELVKMMDEESSLVNEVSSVSVENGLHARERLEEHRGKMEEEPLLKAILDFRQGQPTTLTRLMGLRPPQVKRNIFFVDWFVMSGEFWMALVSASTGISTFRLSFKPEDAKEWKEQFLGFGSYGEHHLDIHDPEPLQRLSSLVKPLLEKSEPGDLLIFCPSEKLHGLPLHAATISAEPPESLIERNPIVYTASMTTFEQCVMRESDKGRDGRTLSHSYMAVLERAENGPLNEAGKRKRDKLYMEIKKIATSSRGSPNNVYLGSDLTADRFATALQSDLALFLGHCKGGPLDGSILNQRLVLEGRNDKELGITVSDLFAIDVKVSHVALLACASGSERRQEGDEPLGLITALLCAGATSVAGNMWRTDVGTARELVRMMELYWGRHTDGGVVDLAGAMQKMIVKLKSGKDGIPRTPYHWATLVLHGAWFLSA
ncbi:hypothetical protein BHE90_001098 [Fusarium euwallaceae]|uniref:CHAT domain-containing protein n=1 Tax=Fusarium euwallaceae TaxID=1147111 RepID=A0A430M8L1_9HYPO|nr:hypothetical protein BHE90_001098 [Fusarium euwallaceae]